MERLSAFNKRISLACVLRRTHHVGYETRDGFDACVIEAVVDELAFALCLHDVGATKDSEVLRGYRLLQAKFHVDVSHIHALVLFEQLDDRLTELVVDGPKRHSGALYRHVIEAGRFVSTFFFADDEGVGRCCCFHWFVRNAW